MSAPDNEADHNAANPVPRLNVIPLIDRGVHKLVRRESCEGEGLDLYLYEAPLSNSKVDIFRIFSVPGSRELFCRTQPTFA